MLWFLRFFLKQASISSMWNAKITPSKTNIAPETQGWKMSFLLGRPSSRCHVSCWECNIQTPRCAMPRRTKPIRISAGMHWWWRPHKKWALFLGYQMGGCITNKNPSRNDKPTTWKKNFQPWIFSFQKKTPKKRGLPREILQHDLPIFPQENLLIPPRYHEECRRCSSCTVAVNHLGCFHGGLGLACWFGLLDWWIETPIYTVFTYIYRLVEFSWSWCFRF